jgi:hypothetical protein
MFVFMYKNMIPEEAEVFSKYSKWDEVDEFGIGKREY